MPLTPRQQRQAKARAAEETVATALGHAGWRIVGRNFRRLGCELDLVAAKGQTLAVIEVKARQEFPQDGRSLEAMVPPLKRAALYRGAAAFMSHYGRTGLTIRFDLAVVRTGTGHASTDELRYFVNIFG